MFGYGGLIVQDIRINFIEKELSVPFNHAQHLIEMVLHFLH